MAGFVALWFAPPLDTFRDPCRSQALDTLPAEAPAPEGNIASTITAKLEELRGKAKWETEADGRDFGGSKADLLCGIAPCSGSGLLTTISNQMQYECGKEPANLFSQTV